MNRQTLAGRMMQLVLAALMAIALAACDAEVKVEPGSPSGDGSDTVVTGGGLGDDRDGNDASDGGSRDGSSGDAGDRDGGGSAGSGSSGNGSSGSGSSGGSGDDKPAPPASSRNIRVTSPRAGETITGRSFTLRGEARTFENSVAYRLRTAGGVVLADGHTTAVGEMGTFSAFATTVSIRQAYTGDAVLEVFQISAKDGSEIDMVRVPLVIRAGEAATPGGGDVTVYFTNTQRNPGAVDCSKVFGVKRSVGSTSGVARAAIEELLRGPSVAERGQSYGTEIPGGTRLRSITIDGGVARADFSRELGTAAGSCRVTAIRAQIERTLRQFPSVRRVVISVEGSSDEALQP